ncbi:phosphoribosylaminoimidazolesuccinocarboxamide synthase [Fuerstiella marisgermanici]|uniref:Phosphoribosylaminoimidazole-succinocarboxamide synthase n=1 Tax=Fuerstiella marisgermanici TaxID=1891926 RepID=A0A1P8WLQ9_9PLAN|nr:phosphoribosylaminoimidazolesuccinocarboxamide synthase [Fuerstiella marisgermanici]APZ94990.1 Phosphoribosylaminoimidazole-succinocarboxamide synthase [Fuerstiella marisgermanici]
MNPVVLQSELGDSSVPVRHGKVRDVYDFGDRLLFVATDRISAFDYVLPTGIPGKGEVLTRISQFWFDRLDVPNHFLSTDVSSLPLPDRTNLAALQGRSMVVRRTDVVPVECVVRGYLSGSGWAEYQKSGTVCGVQLPDGLKESSKLPEPIFTPATKAEEGHDENISFERMSELIGHDLSQRLRELSLKVYQQGVEYARSRGIIVADTKFEFGQIDGELILIDEVMTPDSSRFWPQDQYREGGSQLSFDKQFVRDWLLSSGWDRNSAPPSLPDDVVARTAEKYIEAFEKLTGTKF